MTVKLPDIDGEWEPISLADGIETGTIIKSYKRLPPKEKSLFSTLPEGGSNSYEMGRFRLVCDSIESLEKRVEELAVLERKATEDHYRLLRRLEVLEKCPG